MGEQKEQERRRAEKAEQEQNIKSKRGGELKEQNRSRIEITRVGEEQNRTSRQVQTKKKQVKSRKKKQEQTIKFIVGAKKKDW